MQPLIIIKYSLSYIFLLKGQIRGQSFESKLRNQIKDCPEIKQEFADKMSHILKFETQIKVP